MADNLIVPEVHVQGQLIVDTLDTERGHVADNALKWPVNAEFCGKQIREYSSRIAWLLILVVLCFALNSRNPAAFVRIRIRKGSAGIQTNLGIQPPITMRRILQMVFRKQLDVVKQILGSWRGGSEMFLPIVEAAAVNPHSFTEELHGEFPG